MGMQDLTLDEIAEVEEESGMPLTALSDPTVPKTKLYKSLVHKIKRQDDPGFTLADAGKMTMAEMLEVIGDADPT